MTIEHQPGNPPIAQYGKFKVQFFPKHIMLLNQEMANHPDIHLSICLELNLSESDIIPVKAYLNRLAVKLNIAFDGNYTPDYVAEQCLLKLRARYATGQLDNTLVNAPKEKGVEEESPQPLEQTATDQDLRTASLDSETPQQLPESPAD